MENNIAEKEEKRTDRVQSTKLDEYINNIQEINN